jgi:hypothetical protein
MLIVLRTRDQSSASSGAMPISGCSASSAISERKIGEELSGVKLIFVGTGDASFYSILSTSTLLSMAKKRQSPAQPGRNRDLTGIQEPLSLMRRHSRSN